MSRLLQLLVLIIVLFFCDLVIESNSTFLKKRILQRRKANDGNNAATGLKVNKVVGKGRSVGIDLGTTYSAVSVMQNGKPIIIPVNGSRIVPSIVAYLPDESVVVGEAARKLLPMNPTSTYTSVKRVIGKTAEACVKEGIRIPNLDLRKYKKYDVKGSKNGTAISIPAPYPSMSPLTPEIISSEILKLLISTASEYLGEPVNKAVVTVPAYFMPEQCAATERAGMLAGLEKVKLLREPESAALAYGLTQKDDQVILVFDLGGGTFDVSILEIGGGYAEVIATSGDSYLGGDDFDEVIYEYIVSQIELLSVEASVHCRGNAIAKRRLMDVAIATKIKLSQDKNVTIHVPMVYNDIGITTSLTRGKYESLCKPLYQRLLRPLREVAIMAGVNLPGESGQMSFFDDYEMENIELLTNEEPVESEVPDVDSLRRSQVSGRKDAKERKKIQGSTGKELRRLQKDTGDNQLARFPGGRAIDDVIMVGGATRMPAIMRLVHGITGINPRRTVNPDEAVSLGAAILAGMLDGEVTEMKVLSSWQAALQKAYLELQLEIQSKKQ